MVLKCRGNGCCRIIGSHLVERLLLLRVVVDDFDPWYDSTQRDNLAWASAQDDFDLIEEPLAIDGLRGMLGDPSVVFHQRRPGVQDSGVKVVESSHRNIDLTQRVYEMPNERALRVVYASVHRCMGRTLIGTISLPS